MLYNFIVNNFAPLTGLLFLFVFLLAGKETEKGNRRGFLLLCTLELVELIVYNAELWTASFAEPTALRIFLSALGYSIRPILLLLIFKVAASGRFSKRTYALLAIPAIVNVVIAFSAFFTDNAYTYNEQNHFIRGPLGYAPHVILLFYLICILVVSVGKGGEKIVLENAIIWIICMIIGLAVVMEALYSVRSLGRTAIVLCTIAYYMYFQTRTYGEEIKGYMEQTIASQKEHLREMGIISVLANEYVTICYLDVEKNLVTAYRMDPYIEKRYGEALREGVTFEQVFQAYILQDVCEDDRAFFMNLADLKEMLNYLHQNGSLSKKYRVWRGGTLLYCEMRAELVKTKDGTEDMVFGFSNNDMRVRREMVYQSTVQEEINKVEEAKSSLAGIAELARQLQEAIEDKLSSF